MLNWKVEARGPDTLVTVVGQLNETSRLEPIADEVGAGLVVFNTAGIERINSLGCRQWLRLMSRLQERGNQTALEQCSVGMAQQIVMIRGFEGRGVVRSVFAPYYCESCGFESTALVEFQGGFDVSAYMQRPCPKCGSGMELDDLPEVYEKLATMSGA